MKTSSLLQGLALSLLALSLQACLAPDSVVCASGLLCPPGHSCSADQMSCISNSCGNGIVEAGEVCDDGNVLDHDGCSADCTSDEKCGNGIVDLSMGEVCDDKNQLSGDGCSADCKSDESCGNGIIDVGEMCDTGSLLQGQRCSADCKSDMRCGNGIKDEGELCDDHNNVNGDGCSADCLSIERCGNGIRDGKEECDEGADTPTCINCHIPRCGDGIVQGKEECDTGGESVSCTAKCTLSSCGDGIVNTTAGEECDGAKKEGGHAVDTAACTSECKISRCGDGHVNTAAGEQCDSAATQDGQAVDAKGCTHECKLSSCGDGYTNAADGEQCDDGNALACGTCDAQCRHAQTPGPARGTLIAAQASDIKSGDSFTISDGGKDPWTFVFQMSPEAAFVSSSDAQNPTIPIALTTGLKAFEVADRIITVINDAHSVYRSMKLRAESDDDDLTAIRIINTRTQGDYTSGNQSIVLNIKSNKFSATGMEGGVNACSPGDRCMTDLDCQSGRCAGGFCTAM